MNLHVLRDGAVVLLGHGTALNSDSSAAVRQHAAELQRRGLFGFVREAFWKQEPQVQSVLREVKARRVFIVPVFISEGHFSDEVIPRALGFAAKGKPPGLVRVKVERERSLYYCKPVGTHRLMRDVLLARAREVVSAFPVPRAPQIGEITLFVAGHGTEKNRNSRRVIDEQVGWLRDLKLYAAVHGVFLEEEPRIPAVYELAKTVNIVVVPYFIGEGLHVNEDIPVLLGEREQEVKARAAAGAPGWHNPTERRGKLVWYARSVGTDPRVADVILERVKEAAGGEGGSNLQARG